MLFTVVEARDDDDRHRLAVQRVTVPPSAATYVIAAGSSLEPTDEELESLREVLAYVIPFALLLAGAGGWFLARQSLAPVATMVGRARKIGAEDLGARLPVVNPRDELGRLAETFNDLLERLEAAATQQRQFMADASHELRTPVATSRTAAAVALQQPHRSEEEYREALAIIEQQTTRLSRIVEDMFTLTRADTRSYPVRSGPMYLDEVVDEEAVILIDEPLDAPGRLILDVEPGPGLNHRPIRIELRDDPGAEPLARFHVACRERIALPVPAGPAMRRLYLRVCGNDRRDIPNDPRHLAMRAWSTSRARRRAT